jgi:hypothetical protein
MKSKDAELLAEAYGKMNNKQLLKKSFDEDSWSPLVKVLDKASKYTGSSDKSIAIANITQQLFNLLSGKEGELTPQEHSILTDMGMTLMNMKGSR